MGILRKLFSEFFRFFRFSVDPLPDLPDPLIDTDLPGAYGTRARSRYNTTIHTLSETVCQKK